MERRITVLALAACAALVLAFSLAACMNPIDIVGAVTDEVKAANNRYLIVNDFGPAKNEPAADPGAAIWLEFDRLIDPDTVSPSSISIVDVDSNVATWSFTYDDNQKMLTIQPDALQGQKKYTVTVNRNLLGMDGNYLQNDHIWSFTTADVPAGNIQIDAGASTAADLNVDLAITYNLKAYRMCYGKTLGDIPTTSGDGRWTTLDSTGSLTLDAQVGMHTVYIRFIDSLGNMSQIVADSIWYGEVPNVTATLNTTERGTVAVSWSAVRQDRGTNSYNVYRRVWEIFRYRYYLLGSSTGTGLSASVAEGTLHDFFVRAYNSYAGYSGFNSTPAIGYTSSIAIIYNSADTNDTTAATNLKATLTNSSGWVSTYGVSGTMPSWTVTLIPQDNVSTTYAAGNVFYGYPVIITHATTLYGNANQVRNVTAHGKGVIAMGYGGARLLDVVSSNFSAWGFSGTSPTEIGNGPSAINGSSVFSYTWTSGNSVWTSPLTCPPYIPATNITSVQLAYTAAARVAVYRGTNTNPTNGWLYCRDNVDHYFPVVRQDRFLQYGYYNPPPDRFTGMTFTTNLVYRMSSVYY